MFFNSINFAIFFPIVFIIYWSLKNKPLIYQNIFILISSYIFYAWWDWRFLSLIALSTIVDYFVGIKMSNSNSNHKKKNYLLLSIFINIGLLFVFKYFNFFISSFEQVIHSVGLPFNTKTLNIILPVGISFYTFQTLSYSIDIYKGKIKHTNDFISFAGFVSFFPQLVAGPIERASRLLPQFLHKRTFNYEVAITGLSLICYGFFKKIVIADRLAIYVNNVFGNIDNANTISLLLAIIFFSFQIYADFSGYSLIARGTAKLLGFNLIINFNKPYIADNIQDFWKRWHISLSTWFRDYVYIPLGGNKVLKWRWYYNILITFLISGIWHGANWTFLIWGLIHGLYLIFYMEIKQRNILQDNMIASIKTLNIFLVYTCVTFAWIFFRANNIDHAIEYIVKIFAFDFSSNLVQLCADKGPTNLIISLFSIFLLYITYMLPSDLSFKKISSHLIFNIILIIIITLIGVNGKTEFIYFQF